MSDNFTPAEMDVRQGRPSFWRRLSFVWLVPILALVVSIGVAWQSYADRGVLIEISFPSASGIVAGETEIKYRDVTIGAVEQVEFSEDLQEVLVYARVDQTVWPYMDQDAKFWIISPDVSVRGITGLDTVLSGVYIEGDWDRDADNAQTSFTGLQRPPVVPPGQTGTEIVLRTTEGSALSAGAPVLHQGIEVGVLSQPVLSNDGLNVTVSAFIAEPYDALITSSTRFWDTAGFSISLGAGGVALDVSSLASLIEGGVAFDTVVSGGQPIEDGFVFDLFTDEETARSSLFNEVGRPKLNVAVLFDGSVSGLSVGSDVRFQGIRIGQVSELGAVVVEDEDEARSVELRTVLAIEPGRLGLGEEATPQNALDLLASFVDQGLRARLVTGNILSGNLTVELIEVADAPQADLDVDAIPYPVIPTTASNITDVADEAESVLARINDLPIEELLAAAIDVMDSANALLRSDGVLDTPEQVASLLAEVRDIVGSDQIQQVPSQVNDLLNLLEDTVGGLSGIVRSVGDTNLAGQLDTILGNVSGGTENLPDIAEQVEQVIAKANALALDSLLAQAESALVSIEAAASNDDLQEVPVFLNQLLDEARLLIASQDVQALPGELRSVADEAGQILTDLTAQNISGQLTDAIAAAASAAQNIDAASAQLPAITAQLEELSAEAARMNLEELSTAATQVLQNVSDITATPSAQALPASLSSALDELQLTLAEVREGGAIENVNAALQSASQAAQAIEEAANSLPDLSEQASTFITDSGDVLATYGERSRFNNDLSAVLRDIQQAADAITNLARTIQRNPNSLITGR
ncbi:MlaD family protein [Loktanella sp. SALINAS62]|uniref:MlaD family protein n=1 Tax=Loktanella sp. SALINAS62 TaxID=2706124 RepID=UPI001B8C7DD1|nr:MlaD family protein [Loktanella sp. SALINAS62]MBS1304260.1 MCE family protein [Loktanella sp. SALINAS62]